MNMFPKEGRSARIVKRLPSRTVVTEGNLKAVRKYGKNNVILLNHDISSKIEHEDIKRFKRDVADYLDLDITYANADGYVKGVRCETFRRCVKKKSRLRKKEGEDEHDG